MAVYIVVVIAVSAVFSIALAYTLNKNKLLNIQTILAIAASSITVSLIFPFIFGSLTSNTLDSGNIGHFNLNIIWVSLVSILIYITLIFLVTILISSVVSDKEAKAISESMKNSVLGRLFSSIPAQLGKLSETFKNPQPSLAGDNQQNFVSQLQTEIANQPFDTGSISHEKNILEKSVDSGQNIDTMGVVTLKNIDENSHKEMHNSDKNDENNSVFDIEPIVDVETEDSQIFVALDSPTFETLDIVSDLQTDSEIIPELEAEDEAFTETVQMMVEDTKELVASENLNLDECVDEAFRLKQLGDSEGAILYFMYALDKSPQKDVVFWIVLDICMLYKQLGQGEFAKEILEGYVSSYGDIMEPAVRLEIEKNLT